MGKVFKTKLNVRSKKTCEGLKRLAGIYRKFYNNALEHQLKTCMGYYDVDNEFLRNPQCRFLTGTQLSDYSRKLRKKYPYARKVDVGIIMRAAFTASNAYLKAWKYKIPEKFMSRKKGDIRFKTNSIKVFYDRVKIPKFEEIKLFEKGFIPQGMKYSDITFSFDGKDWWLSLEVSEVNKESCELSGSLTVDFDTEGNLLVNGEKFCDNVVMSDNYKKVNARYERALKKYKRQATANTTVLRSSKVVCRTSRNMMKTRKKVQFLSNRLERMKKDTFKKVANRLAILKPQKVFALSNCAVGKFRNGFLSRRLRESGTLEFFNVIIKKLTLVGSSIIRCEDPHLMLSMP